MAPPANPANRRETTTSICPDDPLAGVRPALARGAAVVAWMPAQPDSRYPAALLRRLSADEQGRAARFWFEKDRAIFIASRILLTCMVDAALGDLAWRFAAARANAKPKLHVTGGRPLFANLSHTPGCVLVALHATADVGVDVQAERGVDDVAGLARLTMTARETAAIASWSPPESLFRRLWVRKEAVLKAFGVGLAGSLNETDVLDPSNVRLPPAMARLLTLVDLNDAPHAAALCILAPNVPVHPIGLELNEIGSR